MTTRFTVILAAVLATGLGAAAAGCQATGSRGAAGAVAVLEAKSKSKLAGRAVFSRMEGSWIRLHVEIAGVEPGLHACHIHETGDCSAPDAKSAGGHWNPTSRKHGQWGQPDGEFHLGDLGNIEVGADGRGSLDLTTDLWTIGDGGPTDVVGRAVVVHAKADDFTTQPTGNAGDRIGCGPIARSAR
jgi:Cu-Zn family superoxide dismutase